MTLRMIDESSWQARTWTAARLKAAGVQVVAVKATEGTTYASPDYQWQVAEAATAGCAIMHYHVARYGDSQKEAEFFWGTTNHFPGDLVMLDNEAQYITALDPAAATAWVSAWSKEVKRLTGAPAVVQYTSEDPIIRGYLRGVGGYGQPVGREPLFLAAPGADPARPPVVQGWPVSFLQFTTRTDQGVQTDVDAAYYGSVAQLRKLGIPAAVPPPGRFPAGRFTATGTSSLAEVAGHNAIKPSDVIAQTVASRVAEHLAGKHTWVLGGSEAAYLDAGDWTAPLPAGSVWWIP